MINLPKGLSVTPLPVRPVLLASPAVASCTSGVVPTTCAATAVAAAADAAARAPPPAPPVPATGSVRALSCVVSLVGGAAAAWAWLATRLHPSCGNKSPPPEDLIYELRSLTLARSVIAFAPLRSPSLPFAPLLPFFAPLFFPFVQDIVSVHRCAFAGFKNIQIIDLSFNKIESLPAKLFDGVGYGLPLLTNLYLENNLLTAMPAAALNAGKGELTILLHAYTTCVHCAIHVLLITPIYINNFAECMNPSPRSERNCIPESPLSLSLSKYSVQDR